MKFSLHYLPWLFASAVTSTSLSAATLAYEGFGTDLSGSGTNYENGVLLPGQGASKPRLGYTGTWSVVNANLSANINARTATGGLSYPGFASGTPGTANPFRIGDRPAGSSANADKWIGRDLTITNAGGQLDDGYYVAVLVDFNGATGGGFGWEFGGRNQFLEYDFDNGNNVTFTSGGNSGETVTFAPSAGTNLFVIQYTADTIGPGGNPNPNFYTRWNLWANPDLSGGELGTVTASGWGIGLIANGVVGDFNSMFVSASNLSDAEMFVDEFYISTTPSAFIIPEPTTYVLVVGFSVLCAAAIYRRRR